MRIAAASLIRFLVCGGTLIASAHVHADGKMADLLNRCAPDVHWSTMSAIVEVESSGKAFAIADAGPLNVPYSQRKNMVRSFSPATLEDAAHIARELIANGHTVSLGLAQVNDRNLPRYGLSIEQVLDPCTNLSTGAKILSAFYVQAAAQYGKGPRALEAAISAYNSGSFVRGVTNGYVDKVYAAAGVVPAFTAGGAGHHPRPVHIGTGMDKGGNGQAVMSRSVMLDMGADSPLSDSSATDRDGE